MKELTDKVAVVTGAASGIGRALADRFASEGMRVVLADVDQEGLESVGGELESRGASIFLRPTDVANADDVEDLAADAAAHFGDLHVVCNNAGIVSPYAAAWEKSAAEWERVVGVNLFGVIHGIRAFVPRLLEHGKDAHIVNTASAAGLISGPFSADYLVTKHAVISLSESLFLELRASDAAVGVTVLCPGFVNTRILESLPERFNGTVARRDELETTYEEHRKMVTVATPPEDIAAEVVSAIHEQRFAILPDEELEPIARHRLECLLGGETPSDATAAEPEEDGSS